MERFGGTGTTQRMLVVAGLTLVGVVASATPAAAVGSATPAAAVGSASPAPAGAGLSITVRRAVLGDTPDTIVVTGRYTCGPFPGGAPERGVLDLGVTQIVNGVEVNGIGYVEPTVCDGLPHRYTAELTAYPGPFARGAATWGASGYVEGPGGAVMQHVYVPPTPIRLRSGG